MAIRRKLDSLRRLSLPANFLNALNLSKGQATEISIQYGKICIAKFENQDLQTKPFIGIIRNLDSQDRIVIPSEYINLLQFNCGDFVNLELENGFIKIKK